MFFTKKKTKQNLVVFVCHSQILCKQHTLTLSPPQNLKKIQKKKRISYQNIYPKYHHFECVNMCLCVFLNLPSDKIQKKRKHKNKVL